MEAHAQQPVAEEEVDQNIPVTIELQDEQVEERQQSHIPIEHLLNVEVSGVGVKKLRDAGYSTVESIRYSIRKDLLLIEGISDSEVDSIIKAASTVIPSKITSANEFHEQSLKMFQITSGSTELDMILNGGIAARSITEVYGESGSGKTQLCHTLCVTCQLPVERKGGNGRAMYIDTVGCFSSQRLLDIAVRFGLNGPDVLNNVSYSRAYNTYDQSKLLIDTASEMMKTRFSLLVVDSATALCRIDFSGMKQLLARQTYLAKFLMKLRNIADVFGVAVVITNQVYAQLGDAVPQIIPVGGHTMAHGANTRLSFSNGRGKERIEKIETGGIHLCSVVYGSLPPETRTKQEGLGDMAPNLLLVKLHV